MSAFEVTGSSTSKNNSGRDGAFQSETTPAYAHSFLLTAILSPDYVDITGNGISDDDIGTAIKFNYTRVNKDGLKNSWYPQKWRTPVEANTAHYNEGLRTDNADDKGLYTYGEKELWYTHSIETKNMVATFRLAKRNDGKQVFGENGGVHNSYGQRKLERIDLYTKADLLRNGTNARPVKTVHFAYSYSLCKGVQNNLTNGGGKLTLDSLWFSYNGNYKQTRNKYRFKYAQGRSGIDANPAYNSTQSDRWGSYKNHHGNPAAMLNADFSYTLQALSDTLKNNVYASAWNLEKIMLPAGAVISVGYEADDYAYVQNKRAAQMTKIAGFGNSPSATPVNRLYDYNALPLFTINPGKMDHQFIFFDVDEPVTSKADIYNKYLEGNKQLLLKIWVEMPANSYGTGYEPVTIYANIKDYFTVAGNPKRICIELQPSYTGGSAIMETVIQFLKDYLPSKAYKGYDVGNQSALRQIVSAVQGMSQSFFQAIEGFENNLKANAKCKQVNLDHSFGRLNNPRYQKFGGGHRVKSIVICDNWQKMINPTSTTPLDSYYGQLYDYTTTENINGVKTKISSGVASYEPGIGNEENPFREVLQYYQQQPLGPTNVSNIELPVTETFFPSPSVGYSKVTVRSIHNKENRNIKSGVGIKETEFYTCREFPVLSDFTDFDSRSRSHFKPNPILTTFFHQNKDFLTLSQGFRVILNDMHGKIKSEANYPENDLLNPVNKTKYYYRLANVSANTFRPDNKIKVINGANGVIGEKLVGKEVELMTDFRDHYASTQSAQIPLNLEAFTVGPIPVAIPSIFRAFFKDESIYRSATILKVVNEFGILDSIVNIDKGSVVSTKNLVYDAETGEVLINRSNNEFNKPVYTTNYPAHWVNSGMDLAYKNIDFIYHNLRFVNGKLESSVPGLLSNFESGDEIYVIDKTNDAPLNSDACIAHGAPYLLPKNNEYKIWALAVSKDEINTGSPAFVFIDRNGDPYNASNATIRIIRSGKRNMGGSSVGNITSLESPLKIIAGVEKLEINNSTGVLNAGAIEFREKWRAQDAYYAVDSTIRLVKWAPIHTDYLPAVDNHAYGEYHENGTKTINTHFYEAIRPDHFLGRQQSFGNHWKKTWRRDRSWILFNIDHIRPEANVLSAKLSLFSHRNYFTGSDVNHNFFWEGAHHNWDPHLAQPDHNNTFRLSRMQSAWPADNDIKWKDLYFDEGNVGFQNETIYAGPLAATKDLTWSGISDDRADVTGILKGMIQDKYDASKKYAPGIKINLLLDDRERRSEARVCFYGKNVTQGKPYGNPLIEAKYFYCSEATSEEPLNKSGYAECVTYQTGRYCFSVFDRKKINPYVHGLLGNWRSYRSYTFYGERKENNFDNPTNISRDGTIKDFVPFWITSATFLQKSGNARWVWNSEITQYNRKGLEIENHDPLHRYNSGVYGYQETLPVLVANNSKVREVAFEGFEDHFYEDVICKPFCKPSKRHFNTGNVLPYIDSTQAHTGKFSMAIPAQDSFAISSVILPYDSINIPRLRIKLDSSINNEIVLNLKGVGLKRIYYSNDNFSGYVKEIPASPASLPFSSGCTAVEPVPPQEYSTWLGGDFCNKFSVKWRGLIQASFTGSHSFWLSNMLDDIGTITISRRSDNVQVYYYSAGLFPQLPPATSVSMQKGELYKIEITLRNTGSNYGIDLQWKLPGRSYFTSVPETNLYPEGQEYLSNNTVTPGGSSWCVIPDSIQATQHHLIDSFSLIPGKRYVLSAWVKENNRDCKCTNYSNNSIQLVFNNNNYESAWKPTGNIIEGWQRYENDFIVPSNASSMKIIFKNEFDKTVYFDDLRIHPFNGNLKSFVYNPANLRLSAELDENNYASFYEYDDEGILSRVKKETREGIKTIKETRTALQQSLSNF